MFCNHLLIVPLLKRTGKNVRSHSSNCHIISFAIKDHNNCHTLRPPQIDTETKVRPAEWFNQSVSVSSQPSTSQPFHYVNVFIADGNLMLLTFVHVISTRTKQTGEGEHAGVGAGKSKFALKIETIFAI